MVSPVVFPVPCCVSWQPADGTTMRLTASRNVFPFVEWQLPLHKGFVALLLILSHAVNLVECWKYSRGPFVSSFSSQGQRSEISLSVNRSFLKSILVIQTLGRLYIVTLTDLVFPTGGRACVVFTITLRHPRRSFI